MKTIGIGVIKLYRIVFAWLPPLVSVRADLLALRRAGDHQVRSVQGELDGGQAHRPLPPMEPGWV